MKRVLVILAVLIFLGIVLKACVRKDMPEDVSIDIKTPDLKEIVYPTDEKNVTINGIDYLQSQAPVGKFGGELVISTIGEGPKTFNPCNTKDATSSSMAGLMYDGLVTTNPRTGEVMPLLAKDIEINGNDYIIRLIHGIKWKDNKPITADDLIYKYNEILYKGYWKPSTIDAILNHIRTEGSLFLTHFLLLILIQRRLYQAELLS